MRKRTMESVYEAVDSLDHRVVEMRRFCSEHFYIWDASVKGEFANLLEEFKDLKHSNLIHFIDAGIDDDGPYVTSPLIEGDLLGDVIQDKERLNQEQVRSLALDILSALEAIHQQNQYHGLWSLDSILVSEEEGDLKCYLANVGLSKIGTILFKEKWSVFDFAEASVLAPELYAKQPATVQSDLYSLGHLMYTTLIGGHPFAELSIEEKAEAHQLGSLPKVSEYIPIDKEFEAWLHRMVHTAPDRRPPSAARAIEDLQSINLKKFSDKEWAESSERLRVAPKLTQPIVTIDAEHSKSTPDELETSAADSVVRQQVLSLRSSSVKSTNKQILWLLISAALCTLSIAGVYFVKKSVNEQELPLFKDTDEDEKKAHLPQPPKKPKPVIPVQTDPFTVELGSNDIAGQVFSADDFAEKIEIGDHQGVFEYRSNKLHSIGFQAAGVSAKTAGNFSVAAGLLCLSQLDSKSTKSQLKFESGATGYVHFKPVSIPRGGGYYFAMQLKDLKGSSNDSDDDIVVRLRLNGEQDQILVDTRGAEKGKVGQRDVYYAFSKDVVEAQLLIDFSSADKRDGYAVGGIKFSQIGESPPKRVLKALLIDEVVFTEQNMSTKSVRSLSGQRIKLDQAAVLEDGLLVFDGSQYAELPRSMIKEIPRNDFSLECEFIPMNGEREVGLISFSDRNGNSYERGILLSIEKNRIKFSIGRGGSSRFATVIASEPLKVGETYHVVGTYDSKVVSLYVNGSLVGTFPFLEQVAYPKKYPPFTIGAFVDEDEKMPFLGRVKRVALYRSALSAAEVTDAASERGLEKGK